MTKDFLYLFTIDQKLHIIDYSSATNTLFPISTFQIDISFGGKKLKEALFTCYDEQSEMIVTVFSSGTVLIVNLAKVKP